MFKVNKINYILSLKDCEEDVDKDFYTDTKRIEDQCNMYALVNKYNYVDINYVPDNLKPLFNNTSIKMVNVAADAYEEFVKAAKNDGITFVGTTAYRSGAFQKQLYDSYVAKDGVEKADTYSARAGHSEHQTGLAIDVNSISDDFIGTPECEWLAQNAHKYGFIIRYPKDKEEYTGFRYEPWNIRYLGEETATKIYESGLSLEEYLGIDSCYR